MNDRLLVVGARGTLGGALVSAARARGVEVHATTRSGAGEGVASRLDLTMDADTWPIPEGLRAAVLCGAVTRLESCRADPAGSRVVNVAGTLALARRLIDRGVFVVFPSTNLVLAGDQPQASPQSPRAPHTEYGRQKAEVEAALESFGDRVAVVRLTKVVHAAWPLVAGWVAALRGGSVITPFEDMTCAPVLLDEATDGLLTLATRRLTGLWQFSGPTDLSYAELARAVAGVLGVAASLVQPASGNAASGGAEAVPAFTSLDAARARTELRLEFPGVHPLVERLLAPGRCRA